MDEYDSALMQSLGRSAAAACIAETVTIPLDTAKVRLQLQSRRLTPDGPSILHYRGPLGTLRTIVREEGITAPFKGLTPGLHRQIIFTGLRLGLYDRLRRRMAQMVPGPSFSESSLPVRILAALTTSAIGITAANPADVVKVRFQAGQGRKVAGPANEGPVQGGISSGRPPGGHHYSSATQAYIDIAREEGFVGGLYKGYVPNLLRNSIISATEIVSYDLTKQEMLTMGFADSIPTHFAAGMTAGLAATLLGSPWDVVGTRLMADTGQHGVFSYVALMLKEEGVASFYKGFVPNFARIGSFNIVLWIAYEQLKSIV